MRFVRAETVKCLRRSALRGYRAVAGCGRGATASSLGVALVGGTPQTSADDRYTPKHWSGEYARPVAPGGL